MYVRTYLHTYTSLSTVVLNNTNHIRNLVHKQMSIYNLRRFVYNLRSFDECFFIYSLLVITHALKLPAKCFIPMLGTHVIVLC